MRRGLFQRPARLEAAHRSEPPRIPPLEITAFPFDHRLRAQWHGNIEVPPDFDAIETRRRAAEFTLPERITDHRARRAATAPIIGGLKDSALLRADAEHIEKVAAHPQPLRVTRLAANREIERLRAPSEHAGKRLLLITKLLPERIGERRIAAL